MKWIVLALTMSLSSAIGVLPKLQISANGRYLVQAGGAPFFLLMDTAWYLPKEPNSNLDLYLDTRKSQGFNAVMVALKYHTEILFSGNGAWTSENTDTPNSTFFAHVDDLVSKADARGFYVFIVVMWSEDHVSLLGSNTTKAYNLGNTLGTRYAASPNVVWVVSGEYDDAGGWNASVYSNIAQGLSDGAGAGDPLITIHPAIHSSSDDWISNANIQFNINQRGHWRDNTVHSRAENYTMVNDDWNLGTVKPTADGENSYEHYPENITTGNTRINAWDIRRMAYWGLFAGGFGTTYGHGSIERVWNPGETVVPSGTVMPPWQEALRYPGAEAMKHVRALIESRPFLTRMPDQTVITSGAGSGLTVARACRDSNNTYAMVYIPQGGSVTVDMTKVRGPSVKASWFNPQTGQYTDIGLFPNTGTQAFDPSGATAEGNDWVLVLDSYAPAPTRNKPGSAGVRTGRI